LPFTHVIVDEAQDISVAELMLLGSMFGGRPNGLFFAGDIGQRIFRAPFPWSAAGVDVRGRPGAGAVICGRLPFCKGFFD